MPLFLILAGVIAIWVALRPADKRGEAFELLKLELFGNDKGRQGFVNWAAGVTVIALLGLWGPLKPVSNGLLFLVSVAWILGVANRLGDRNLGL